jgi:hypothetical protein
MGCSFSRSVKIAVDGSGDGSTAPPFPLPRDAPGAETTAEHGSGDRSRRAAPPFALPRDAPGAVTTAEHGSGDRSRRAAPPFALPRDAPGAVTTLLSVLSGAHSVGAGVFGFLTTREARALRLVSHECREAVAAARWCDTDTRIKGPLAAWRACFPGAVAANVCLRDDLRDADFAHLAGVKELVMWDCPMITGAGLAHLDGIRTLSIDEECTGITDACLARLAGIHTLSMQCCAHITDAGLAHLSRNPFAEHGRVRRNHRRRPRAPFRHPFADHQLLRRDHRRRPRAPFWHPRSDNAHAWSPLFQPRSPPRPRGPGYSPGGLQTRRNRGCSRAGAPRGIAESAENTHTLAQFNVVSFFFSVPAPGANLSLLTAPPFHELQLAGCPPHNARPLNTAGPPNLAQSAGGGRVPIVQMFTPVSLYPPPPLPLPPSSPLLPRSPPSLRP